MPMPQSQAQHHDCAARRVHPTGRTCTSPTFEAAPHPALVAFACLLGRAVARKMFTAAIASSSPGASAQEAADA